MQKDNWTQKCQLLVYCLVFTGIIFLLNPIFTILFQKTGDIDFFFKSFFASLVIFYSTAFALLSIIFLILSKKLKKNKIENFTLFLSIYIFLCMINPITKQNTALMSGINVEINYLYLAVNVGSSIGIYFLIYEKKKLQIIMLAALLLMTLVIGYMANTKLSYTKIPKKFNFELGDLNLIVFSFDGIPGITINEFFSDPTFINTFKDFTLQKNSISHSPATYASIYQELYGGMDWKAVASTQKNLEQLSDNLEGNEQIWYLDNATRYGTYSEFGSQFNDNLLIKNGSFLLGKRNSLLTFVAEPIISSSFCKFGFCVLGKKYGNFGNYFRKILIITGNVSSRMRSSKNDFEALEKIINGLKKGNGAFGAFFGHFEFTHSPVLQDENCEFLNTSLKQNEQLLKKQAQCLIKLMGNIIDKLKVNDLYQKSLIVFKSDHGKPNTYFDKNSIRGKTLFNKNNPWGYDRYRPFVMYKQPNQINENLNINEALFYLSELGQIYCNIYQYNNALTKRNCLYIEEYMKTSYPHVKIVKDLLFVPKSSKTFRYDGHSVFRNKKTIKQMEEMFSSWSIN